MLPGAKLLRLPICSARGKGADSWPGFQRCGYMFGTATMDLGGKNFFPDLTALWENEPGKWVWEWGVGTEGSRKELRVSLNKEETVQIERKQWHEKC